MLGPDWEREVEYEPGKVFRFTDMWHRWCYECAASDHCMPIEEYIRQEKNDWFEDEGGE